MTRKKQQPRSLSRRPPSVEPRDRVLIVCEGKKTEPNYFKRLRGMLRLSSTTVKVVHEGPSPITVVKTAVKYRGDYDHV